MSESIKTQYGIPILCDKDGKDTYPLQRVELEKGTECVYDEKWLQELIYTHPNLLPVNDIDPIFGELIPVCRELSTAVGFLDNLYINELGMLTLVECKLWRNPGARRKVVGQILDYAQEFSRWSYEDLLYRVQTTLKKTDNILFDIVKQHTLSLKEQAFIDHVSINLKKGRFLLLIVGDGIRESVEQISTYLQEHAQLNFTFALVEETIFTLPKQLGGHLLVQPRVLAKTIEIERAVIKIEGQNIVVESPITEHTDTKRLGKRRGTITEQVFYEELGRVSSELPSAVQSFFQEVEELGLILDPGGAGIMIKTKDKSFNFALFHKDGYLRNFGCGTSELGQQYLHDLATILDNTKIQVASDGFTSTVKKKDNSYVSLSELLLKQDEWLELIKKVLTAIQDTE